MSQDTECLAPLFFLTAYNSLQLWLEQLMKGQSETRNKQGNKIYFSPLTCEINAPKEMATARKHA